MFDNFILNEIVFAVLWVIAIVLCREFIIAKDGMLRKILICYFGWEAVLYFCSAVYFAALKYGYTTLSPDVFRFCMLLPKAVVKVWFVIWLKRGNFIRHSK